jgi:uncharacterized membrane protein YedE/YeeE
VFTLWAGLAVFLSCPLVCRLYHGILNLLVFDRKFPRIITLIFYMLATVLLRHPALLPIIF